MVLALLTNMNVHFIQCDGHFTAVFSTKTTQKHMNPYSTQTGQGLQDSLKIISRFVFNGVETKSPECQIFVVLCLVLFFYWLIFALFHLPLY